MRVRLVVLAVLVFPAAAGAANINKHGAITASETWAPPDTYTMTGDVSLKSGVTLTIAAGTQVTVATTDATGGGTDQTQVELIVQSGATLSVQGASTSPVVFSSSGAWYGIEVNAPGGTTAGGS